MKKLFVIYRKGLNQLYIADQWMRIIEIYSQHKDGAPKYFTISGYVRKSDIILGEL